MRNLCGSNGKKRGLEFCAETSGVAVTTSVVLSWAMGNLGSSQDGGGVV